MLSLVGLANLTQPNGQRIGALSSGPAVLKEQLVLVLLLQLTDRRPQHDPLLDHQKVYFSATVW
jgi:hypothetical protein